MAAKRQFQKSKNMTGRQQTKQTFLISGKSTKDEEKGEQR